MSYECKVQIIGENRTVIASSTFEREEASPECTYQDVLNWAGFSTYSSLIAFIEDRSGYSTGYVTKITQHASLPIDSDPDPINFYIQPYYSQFTVTTYINGLVYDTKVLDTYFNYRTGTYERKISRWIDGSGILIPDGSFNHAVVYGITYTSLDDEVSALNPIYNQSMAIHIYYTNPQWRNATPYIFHNGEWVQATPYIFHNGTWEEVSPNIYTGG